MLRWIKVTGHSLEPDYQEGDFVLLLRVPFFSRPLREGDTVVLRHPHYGTLIKQVEWLSPDGETVFVVGSHPESTDSRQFGPIHKGDVLGRVVWHIRRS